MKIPVFLRANNSVTWECVAIADSCPSAYCIEGKLQDPYDGKVTQGCESRQAKIHKLSDGNLYAEEVVKPSEYLEAEEFWSRVFALKMRDRQPFTSQSGFITPRT